ncbi:hypothetical protein ACJRO7_000913 [Eucalyptus globulus]|uniref:BED-type domain-containing protein n=1 Tax=Eucalyptus globulus TaxID=34317 RepID=A0ABD3LP92_EUCGL
MVRGRDACWEHCVLVDATKQKVRCNYCEREFSGGVYRMKFHLAQIKNKDIVPCSKVPNDVRDHIRSILSTPKKQKTLKKPKVDWTANGQQHSSSGSENSHANHYSSGQRESSCPPLFLLQNSPSLPAADDAQKQKQDYADKKIATFFFHNSIPFNVTKSIYYQEMVDAIAECELGYKAPNYDSLRSVLLEKVKDDIQDCYRKLKDNWKDCGCTVLCESWCSTKSQSLVVFTVTCPKGAIFLRSIDVSGHEDDATYLFEVIETVVLEVGLESVVQVITDSTASYIYAGRLLMDKYSSLFWSPCASYCVNKMLEDMSKEGWVCTVLEEAKIITQYIYSNTLRLGVMRNLNGGEELTRPKITQFATRFLSLRSIVIQEDTLKHTFSHMQWFSSDYSRFPDAQAFKSLLHSERFWKSAHEVVSVSEPLIKILRMVDGDMPAIGYLYEAVERAKISIKEYYKGVEERYIPIWNIIDHRWNMQLQSTIHAAAAFLNPSIFYNPNCKIDLRIRNGFQEAMRKVACSDLDKVEITKEHPVYINKHGALGTDFAIMRRTLNAPGDWWAAYGYEIPTLQKVAIRILSQPCSLHWCKWNWATFESLHTKKRNAEEFKKLGDLVFMHSNLWLKSIHESWDRRCKPINFDEIDVSSDWPTELDPSAPLLIDTWSDDLLAECKVVPDFADNQRIG